MASSRLVPYANYAATETLWAQLLNTNGVAKRYGTHVFASLRDLKRQLEGDSREPRD